MCERRTVHVFGLLACLSTSPRLFPSQDGNSSVLGSPALSEGNSVAKSDSSILVPSIASRPAAVEADSSVTGGRTQTNALAGLR